MSHQTSNSPWHSLEIEQVFAQLKTTKSGLNDAQLGSLQQQFGPNRLTPIKPRNTLQRLLAQFNNVLIYLLLTAAVTTALLQQWLDCGVIVAVVLLNALIGMIQEGKAEKALDAIREMLSQQAAVVREEKNLIIPAEALLPGDVVLLQSGDKVPADLRLFSDKSLHIDESILTGESLPVTKQSAPLKQHLALGDRHCMAYSGTLVSYGQGRGVVVSTGDNTEIGHINALLSTVQPLNTPLLEQMARFARWLSATILLVALLSSLFGVLAHHASVAEMFLAAVGLAVAAIPEGLPAIMTITLAIGVKHMAQRNAIIRRLPAVETLGSVTVICSDKTGTLTRNEMTVQSILTAEHLFNVSGVGYDPHGNFSYRSQQIEPAQQPMLYELCRAAVLCNDAQVHQTNGRWVMQGDPTEGALITLGLKAGLNIELEHAEWPRSDEIPFESQHRFMATLHHDHAGHGFVYIKGAPERILEMCHYQRQQGEAQPINKDYWQQQIEQLAQQGLRLLAIAFKQMQAEQHELKFNDIKGQLTLLGVVGIIDPPRDEVITAIANCRQAGIQIKMITGDHAATATAIAQRIGLGDELHSLTGEQLDDMSDQQLQHALNHTGIFARTSPQHKLRLVQALQSQAHVVAMTGDGVNDAPALKQADVGIAMGQKGTEVSKEAAEMVLTDDNFTSISNAIEEGRTVYDNLKKSILFILPTNGGEAFTLVAAILLGVALPITPAQILWVNMITAVTLALALAFEPQEPQVMRRPPRQRQQPILSRHLIWRTLFVSILIVCATFGLFLWEQAQGATLEYARTVAVNTLVMSEIAYLFSARHITQSAINWQSFTSNRYALLAVAALLLIQLSYTYLPAIQQLFHAQALSLESWVRIIFAAITLFLLVELEKFLLRRYQNKQAPAPQ